MPRALTKPGRGLSLRWQVSRESKTSKTILLSLKRSRKRYSSVTLSKSLSDCLRECFVLSLLTLRSELTTTAERQELSKRLQRTRTTRSLTSAYLEWHRSYIDFSSPTAGSFGFLVLPGTNGLRLLFAQLDSSLTKCLSSGIARTGAVIQQDQTGILRVATTWRSTV